MNRSLIGVLVALFVALASCQEMYDDFFYRDEDGTIFAVHNPDFSSPIEIDPVMDPMIASYRCARHYDDCCAGTCRSRECWDCYERCKYDCRPRPKPSQPCKCDCNCKFDRKCPDCVNICRPNVTVPTSPASSLCQIEGDQIAGCVTGQSSRDQLTSLTAPGAPAGIEIVETINGRRELIHLVFNGTVTVMSTNARLSFFNLPAPATPIVERVYNCPGAPASPCVVPLCEVQTFTGIDLVANEGAPALTLSGTGANFIGTITAGTCS